MAAEREARCRRRAGEQAGAPRPKDSGESARGRAGAAGRCVDTARPRRYQRRQIGLRTGPGRNKRLAPLLEVKDLHTEFRTGAGLVRAVDGISYTV